MSQPGRTEGASRGDGESQNHGADRGLAQSLHAREATTEDNNNATNRGRSDSETISEEAKAFEIKKNTLYKQFQDVVDRRGAFDDIFEAAERYFDHVLPSNPERERTENVEKRLDSIEASLKRIENSTKTQQSMPAGRTWAQIASGGRNAVASPPPREHVVPKKAFREIVITLPKDLQSRAELTSEGIVHGINKAIPIGGAIAAKRLPRSGDVVVSFEDDKWPWYNDLKNENWVREVFTDAAQMRRRTYAVLAKGVDPSIAERYGEGEGNDMVESLDELQRQISEQSQVNIVRVRTRLPRRSNEGTAKPKSIQLLLEVHSVEEAIKLIDRGMIHNYRRYPCERFEGEARAV